MVIKIVIKKARVSAVHKERYELLTDNRQIHGKLKKSIYLQGDEQYPTTGDFVDILINPDGDSLIIKTHERSSSFTRLDPDIRRPREQSVAANFDIVFIMQSLNQDFNPRRIERYLALAWQSGATPIIVLTKSDLVEDANEQIELLKPAAMGVDIITVSAVTGAGLDTLAKYITPGKTVVFLGSSGVGKSSLVNTLAGCDIMDVKGIRLDDAKGRHTTTHRQLVKLPNGAYIIDTPGMRQLGMWDAADGLSTSFTDVEAHLGRCRFSDCRHNNEPGCAVRSAIESGELSQTRWDSYNKLKREVMYSENKMAAMREKFERNKGIAKWSKSKNKETW